MSDLWQDVLRVIEPILFKCIDLGTSPTAHLNQCLIDSFNDVTMGHVGNGQIVLIFLGQCEFKLCVTMRLWVGGHDGGWCGVMDACAEDQGIGALLGLLGHVVDVNVG